MSRKVISIEDFQKRYPTPEEVKRILEPEDFDWEFSEEQTSEDTRILITKVIFNVPIYIRVIALMFLVIYIVSISTIFLGWSIFENKAHWMIGIGISLLVISKAKDFINACKRHQQIYSFAITKNLLLCAILPKNYIEEVNIHEFIKQHPESTLFNFEKLLKDYKQAEKEAEQRSIENPEKGIKIFHISRQALVTVSKRYIVLRDDENEFVIPYNKRALEFLKTVALMSN